MSNIAYLTNLVRKGLRVTIIATPAIAVLINLTASCLVTNKQTTSFSHLQSLSVSVNNELVDISVKAVEAKEARWQQTKESFRKKGNQRSDLESNTLVAVKQAKYIQDQALKLEYSLNKTVTLVKELEGFRSSAYIDTDGTVVIGYGMPVIEGKKVKLGDRISQIQAETALRDKLQEIQQQILAATTVELNSNQLVSLTSFTFNVGVEPLLKSTLLKKLNAGDALGAADEFPRWNKASMNGKLATLAGLSKRRLTEKNLFLNTVN